MAPFSIMRSRANTGPFRFKIINKFISKYLCLIAYLN